MSEHLKNRIAGLAGIILQRVDQGRYDRARSLYDEMGKALDQLIEAKKGVDESGTESGGIAS